MVKEKSKIAHAQSMTIQKIKQKKKKNNVPLWRNHIFSLSDSQLGKIAPALYISLIFFFPGSFLKK